MNNVFVYKELNIPKFEKIKEEIHKFYQTATATFSYPGIFTIVKKDEVLNSLPTLSSWFIENQLEVKRVAYISIAARGRQVVHVDHGEFELAMNFPVINCKNVLTEFFEFKEQDLSIDYTKTTNLPFLNYNDIDNKSSICSFELIKPILLNIKMPHRVVNNTSLERISLSFRFEKDPWHLI